MGTSIARVPRPPDRPISVLLFTKTAPSGYRHASIPAAVSAFQRLAGRRGFALVASEADDELTPLTLAGHDTVVFLHNIDTFLSPTQLDTLKDYVRAGGGFVGVHSASASMLDDEWYGRLLGAHFDSHPKAQWGTIEVEDRGHFITAGDSTLYSKDLSKQLRWFDEWYNFKSQPRAAGVHVLMTVDEASYEGGRHGKAHPIAWCHEFESARVFYTSLGHFDTAFEDDWFMGQLERGIFWTARAVD